MSSKNRHLEFFESDIFDQDRANTILADDTIFFTLKDSQIERFNIFMGFNGLHKFKENSETARKIENIIIESVLISRSICFVTCSLTLRTIFDSFSFVISQKKGDEETYLFFSRTDITDCQDDTYTLVARLYLKNNNLYSKEKKPVFTYYKPTCLTSDFLSFTFYDNHGKKNFIYESIDQFNRNRKKIKIEGYPGDSEELELACIYFENNRVSDYCFKLKDCLYSYEYLTKKIPWFDNYSLSDVRKINTKLSDSEKALIDMLLL